jgi:hypothetical protein
MKRLEECRQLKKRRLERKLILIGQNQDKKWGNSSCKVLIISLQEEEKEFNQQEELHSLILNLNQLQSVATFNAMELKKIILLRSTTKENSVLIDILCKVLLILKETGNKTKNHREEEI